MTRPALLLALWLLLALPALAAPPASVMPTDPEAGQEAPGATSPLAPPAPVTPALPPAVPSGPTTPKVHSQYAVLVDATTGKILWARHPDTERSIASTTKIMTAVLLLERGHLNDTVTAPKGVDKIEESSLHLSPGETLTLHDLLYAMLLRSANDTAVAGADYLCGSVPAFAAQMNAKARELNLAHTHYVTPNGLYAPGHYSTAADLAHLACYAVNTLPQFNAIVHTQKYKIQRSMHVHDEWVKNTASEFLKGFPGADGIKTGYIHQAGHCFVGSATRTDATGHPWRLIAVALNSPTCREDVMSLLNYGYANFVPDLVVPQGVTVGTVNVSRAASPVPVKVASDLRAIVSRWRAAPAFQTRLTPLPVSAPVAPGVKVATVTVWADGKPQATGDAVAVRSVPLTPALALLGTGKRIGLDALRAAAALLGVAAVCFLGVTFYVRVAGKIKPFRFWRSLLPGAASESARRRRSWLAPGLRRVD